MNHDLKAVDAKPGLLLSVELMDGRVGVFDMKPHLDRPGFSALRDPAYFGRVRVL
jgi:hypothetical protein